MSKRWYYYQMNPIDFNWDFLDTVEETVRKLSRFHGDEQEPSSFEDLHGFLNDWKRAKEIAHEGYWEGDFRSPPKVFWLPDENEFVYAFAWKQDNNGSTF